MDADERLSDLKKAYAAMILNTAKEAAARIMVSERKALRLEFELKNSKEDALQMLMRLKQMMDSKISVAEAASRAQQKKIEELEAQLQEAHDAVKELREELSVVQAELETAPTRKEVKHAVQANEASEQNTLVRGSDTDQSSQGQSSYSSLFPFRKSWVAKQGLASIILRSKGTKLCRSGSTRRIRACERTLVDRELSLAEETSHIMPDLVTQDDEEGEKLHKTPSLRGERKKRKKAIPMRKNRTLWSNQPLDQENEMDHVIDSSCLTSPRSVKQSIPKKPSEGTNGGTVLVRVCDIHRRIREALQTMGCEETELPLSLEAEVDPPESKASETSEGPIQPISGRAIKYTFQRKRKRGVLSTDGNALSNDLRRAEENKNDVLESERVNSVEESTQEESYLQQVARQLVSLSDEKWWQ